MAWAQSSTLAKSVQTGFFDKRNRNYISAHVIGRIEILARFRQIVELKADWSTGWPNRTNSETWAVIWLVHSPRDNIIFRKCDRMRQNSGRKIEVEFWIGNFEIFHRAIFMLESILNFTILWVEVWQTVVEHAVWMGRFATGNWMWPEGGISG